MQKNLTGHTIYMRCTSRAAEMQNRSPENGSPENGSPENGSQFQQPEKCNAYIQKNVTGVVDHTMFFVAFFYCMYFDAFSFGDIKSLAYS